MVGRKPVRLGLGGDQHPGAVAIWAEMAPQHRDKRLQ